jgi:hypothetical protein
MDNMSNEYAREVHVKRRIKAVHPFVISEAEATGNFHCMPKTFHCNKMSD